MEFLIMLPLIPTIWYLMRRSAADAVIDVYLPVHLLVPLYYSFRVPHLPGVNASTVVLIPICLFVFAKKISQWRFERADLWLALFVLGLGYAESANTNLGNAGFDVFGLLTAAGMPYMIGKAVIEDDNVRERFMRRYVSLLAIVALLSIFEWRMGRNVFELMYAPIFHHGSPNIQMFRGGFARIQGPFAHAINAGIIFGSGWVMSLWVAGVDKRKLGASEKKYFGVRRSVVIASLVFFGLVMTGSRGPWMGAVVAFAVSRIGRAQNVKRAAIITVLVGTMVGGAGYTYLDSYTSGSIGDAKNQDQENAIYRRVLLDAYKPIAEAGGVFGWGAAAFPRVPGQESVDNYFLLLRLTQGWLGLCTFLLLSLEACLALLFALRRVSDKIDISFIFCLLGIVVGALVSLTSVALDWQPYQFFFLCLGWSLAVRPTQTFAAAPAIQPQGRFAFARRFS